MGTVVKSDRLEYKRSPGEQHIFLPVSFRLCRDLFKRIKMAELKVMIFLSNILGIPLFGYTIWINWGGWKADMLFIMSGLYAVVRLYFAIRKGFQDIKNRDLSIRKKEHDVNKEIKDDE